MMTKFANEYPNLFQEKTWPWGPTKHQFQLFDAAPPIDLISNVNVIPRIKNDWVIIQLKDGTWEIPGGTVEPGESYTDTIKRELLEEAGADLKSFQIFGAWHCLSLAPKPYRPHLPHPESYRVVGVGDVEIVQHPENPDDGEQISLVACVSLQTAVERFLSIERPDLAELYRLAARLSLKRG